MQKGCQDPIHFLASFWAYCSFVKSIPLFEIKLDYSLYNSKGMGGGRGGGVGEGGGRKNIGMFSFNLGFPRLVILGEGQWTSMISPMFQRHLKYYTSGFLS